MSLTQLDDRSISLLVKKNTRQKILDAAAPLIHSQGFHRTGLKEILDTAGVPKGSFYFYFKSKEDFGLALIDHYVENLRAMSGPVLADDGASPLGRLERFYSMLCERMAADGCVRGCPIGNLAQEVSDLSPEMREKLSGVLGGMSRMTQSLLDEAAKRGELAPGFDPERAAAFVLDAWEGAVLRAKTDKDPAALDRFQEFVFKRLLA